MLTVLALLAINHVDDNLSFDYSGFPQLRASAPFAIRSHGVTLDADAKNVEVSKDGTVTVTSITVFRYQGNEDCVGTVVIPRIRVGDEQSGQATFKVEATWDKKKIDLSPDTPKGTQKGGGKEVTYRNDLSGMVMYKKQGTHALRITYKVALGRAGYEQKQRIVGYLLNPPMPVDLLAISYRFAESTMFGLPAVAPDLGWSIGDKGATYRKENFQASKQLTSVVFYPTDLGNIFR